MPMRAGSRRRTASRSLAVHGPASWGLGGCFEAHFSPALAALMTVARSSHFIRYSRFANVEWRYGVKASGCVCGAQDCRGQVGPRAVLLTRCAVGNEPFRGARFCAACSRLPVAPRSSTEEPPEL